MNCKFCNAELNEGAAFCPECGASVENQIQEEPLKCGSCGADLIPGSAFCAHCGAPAAGGSQPNIGNTGNMQSVPNAPDAQNMQSPQSFVNSIFGSGANKTKIIIIGAVCAVVLLVGGIFADRALAARSRKSSAAPSSSSSSSSVSSGNTSSGSSSSSSSSGSKSSSGTKSSSSSVKTQSDEYYKNIASSALYNEITKKYKAADAGSTKYSVNKVEKQKDYTIVYGTLHLYDKYGKATTGYSDNSGSYTRTFEVKIKTDTGTVSSCTIK